MKYLNSKFKVLFLFLFIGLANGTYAQWGLLDDLLKAGAKVADDVAKVADDAAKLADDAAKKADDAAKKAVKIDEFFYTKIDDFSNKNLDDLKKAYPDENLMFVDDTNKKYYYRYETQQFVVNEQFKLDISLNNNITVDDCIKFAQRKIDPAKIYTASILDPKSSATIRRQLENGAKINNRKHTFLTSENLEETIKSAEGGTLLLTSHFEDGMLYAVDNFNNLIKDRAFSKDIINQIADKHNVQVSFLGCETKYIRRGTGFKNPIFDEDVANSIVDVMGLKDPITREELNKMIVKHMGKENELIVSTLDLIKETHITNTVKPTGKATKAKDAAIVLKNKVSSEKVNIQATDTSSNNGLLIVFFIVAGVGLIVYYKKQKK